MRKDLFTTIGVAIVGIILAFFITNLVIQPIGNFTVPTIDTSTTATKTDNYNFSNLDEPNNEVFNYYALNPTVEVYVGECEQYAENGTCVVRTTTTSAEEQNNPNGVVNPSDISSGTGNNSGNNSSEEE